MDISELTAYAKQKYGIDEQHKWADFPQFSVLCHPVTGKWIALLMRQWDIDTGTEYFCCDIKCGALAREERYRPYLSYPFRMRGREWTGVNLTYVVKPDFVLSLIDRAVEYGNGTGFTVVLEQENGAAGSGIITGRETVIPPRKGAPQQPGIPQPPEVPQQPPVPQQPGIPPRPAAATYGNRALNEIALGLAREKGRFAAMRRLYVYGNSTHRGKIENFLRQGRFMKDYEDDFPWYGEFFRYYPTYNDLDDDRLRGYFSWRTKARKGVFEKIPVSAAYIYVYELLNGIGTASPEESLAKMREFVSGFIDAGFGDDTMRKNVEQWMTAFAIVKGLPRETVLEVENARIRTIDNSLEILRNPEDAANGDIVVALEALSKRKITESPVIKNDPDRGARLFADVWRLASKEFTNDKMNLFDFCFGKPETHTWQPLGNALVPPPAGNEEVIYELNGVHVFRRRGGKWKERSYPEYTFPSGNLAVFVHGMDGLLRRYLKTGNYLHKKESDEIARPYVERVTAVDAKEVLEASRPVITVDISSLDRIRSDADVTRDSLLTEQEQADEAAEKIPEAAEKVTEIEEKVTENAEIVTEAAEKVTENAEKPAENAENNQENAEKNQENGATFEILRALLEGGSPDAIIRERHLMPSVVADSINEEFFGDFGDSVVSSDGGSISLVDDYKEELAEMLGIHLLGRE